MSNLLVASGGSAETNGLYVKGAGLVGGKNWYDRGGGNFTYWFSSGPYWVVEYGGLFYYLSFSNTAEPWQATGWFRSSGINPAPTFSEVAAENISHFIGQAASGITHLNGIALSGLSHINGIAK